MKKIIIIAAVFAATSLQAQSIDTVKSAIQVTPIVLNAIAKDTLYQLTVNVFDLKVGDTTMGCNSYVTFFDRKAKSIGAINVPITAQIVNAWNSDDKIIENFILTFLNLTRK